MKYLRENSQFIQIFLLLVALAILLVVDLTHSFNGTDDGFIFGYSWRILNGETPYLDFIYPRPPATPIFWAFMLNFLPEGYVFLSARFVVLLQMIFPFFIIWSLFKEQFNRLLLLLLIFLYSLISLSAFPLMPWHTVDGVFFSYVALGCIIYGMKANGKSAFTSLLFGSCICFAALTKQNFAISSFAIFLIYLFINKKSPQRIFLSIVGVFLVLFLMLAKIRPEGFYEMLRQMQSVSTSGAFLNAALFDYAKTSVILPTVCLLVVYKVLNFSKVSFKLTDVRWFVLLVPILLFLAPGTYRYFLSGQILLVFLVTLFVYSIFRPGLKMNKEVLVFALGSFIIAWASSISWGYRTPLLGIVGLSVLHLTFLSQYGWNRWQIQMLLIVAFIYMISLFTYRLSEPYRDESIINQSSDLGSLFSQMGGISTNDKYFRRLSELKYRFEVESVANRVAIWPSSGFFWINMKKLNPLPMDWLLPEEYRGSEVRVREAMVSSVDKVLIDKNEGDSCSLPAELSKLVDGVANLHLDSIGKNVCTWALKRK